MKFNVIQVEMFMDEVMFESFIHTIFSSSISEPLLGVTATGDRMKQALEKIRYFSMFDSC